MAYLNEVSQIVDFFNKPDEIRRLKRKINDLILQTDHTDQEFARLNDDGLMTWVPTHSIRCRLGRVASTCGLRSADYGVVQTGWR